jgi:hypothetical protein
MIIKLFLTLILSILSGIFGRMGGAEGYDTLYRDIGCSILSIAVFCIWFGFKLDYWWIYLIVFGLHWGAFSTYYDTIFGFDNLWFSGFIVGMALFPLLFVYKIIPFFFIRAILLAILWGLYNTQIKPNYILCWRHDIVEEFLRYFSIIITYLIK